MSKQNYTYSTGEYIAGEVRRRVGDDADTSIEFMGEDSLILAINQFKQQLVMAPFTGMEIDEAGRIRVEPTNKGWDFMEDDTQFSFLTKTGLAAELTKGSTGNAELTSVTGYDNEAGAVMIYDQNGTWDFITYTSVASPNLGAVGDVDITHAIGEEVYKLNKLPANFSRAKNLWVAGEPFIEGPEDPVGEYFTTYNGFLWVPRDLYSITGTLKYWKQDTFISALTETLDIPNILNMPLIHLLCARAFDLGGAPEKYVMREQFAAADGLRQALKFTTFSSNTKLRHPRAKIHSPHYPMGGRVPSRFDSANYSQ